MPYFERKPYEALVQEALAPMAGPDSADAPISDLARAVLAAETEQKHLLDGPFTCRGACPPGGSASIVLTISVAEGCGPASFTIEAGDLDDGNKHFIAADRIRISPNSMTLDEGDTVEVVISLRVPDLATPGTYQGRMNVFGAEHTGIVVIFEVTAAQG